MAANKFPMVVGLFSILISAFASAKGSADFDDAALDLAKRDFLQATVDLGEAVTSCSQKGKDRVKPVLSKEALANLGAGLDDVLVAVGHLSAKNSFECEKGARLAVSYAIGTLTNVVRELGLSSEALGEVERILIYPPLRDLKYRLKYNKLNLGLREYLEQVIGDQPFEIIPMLEESGLLSEENTGQALQ